VVQLQKFGHRDQECRKLQIGYHNKISSGKFSFKIIEVESCQYKGRLPILNIFCIQHSPTYLNFLTRRHLALDWLLYSFFKGGAIFGRNHHNKFINGSGLLEQNERPLGRPLTDSERRN